MPTDLFTAYLQLPTDELEWEFGGADHFVLDEGDFLINPRRLRGNDFLMRWAQGRWSEEIVIRALNQTSQWGVIPIIPTVIVKQEDIPRLQQWEADYRIPIYVVHIFYDRGYFVKFDDVLAWLDSGELGLETQRFTNPDGTASSAKQIVKVPYVLCQEFGAVSGPQLVPRTFVDKNGKVMTYVTFEGGEVHLSPAVFEEWGR